MDTKDGLIKTDTLGTGAPRPVGTLDGVDVMVFERGDNRQRGEEVLAQ